MNATSSRAHTIVGIKFIQKSTNAAGEEMAKTAEVNLVDLAGSERAESTGATGDRLKEGAAINQSLSSLGNCIAALAERSSGKNTRVPYRNSVLTKLLKNALGGNSKTVMIAALSPADINYDETLSTLRYADRAKQIKTTAKVNEDPTAALIRELQEENEKLKAMLASGKVDMSLLSEGGEDDDMTEDEKAQMKKELENEYQSMLEKNKQEMENMEKQFQERLAEAQSSGDYAVIAEINEKKKTYPHLYNLNMDPQMTGKIIHFIIEDQETIIGNGKAEGTDLTLRGGSIQDVHCKIMEKDGVFTLETFSNARTLRNGKSVTVETKTLKHFDRLLFGTTQFYVFCNPKEAGQSTAAPPDFESAQAEIAQKSGGFDMSGGNKSRDDALLQQDLIEVMPACEEANSISEALDKRKRFDMIIVAPEARGELNGRTEVMVKMTDVDTRREWMWSRTKFLDRRCIMAEMYDKYEDGEEWNLPKEKDPFYDEPDADCHIGSVKVWTQSLSYMIETSETLDITDYKGTSVGKMTIGLFPCDAKGKEYTEKDDMFVENPDDLLKRQTGINFKVKIVNGRGLPANYSTFYCKHRIYLEDKDSQTKAINNTTNPDFNYERVVTLPTNKEVVDFLKEGAFIIQLWGKQKDMKPKPGIKKKMSSMGGIHALNTNQQKFDPEKVRYMMEVAALKKRQEKMELKLAHMRKMIETAEEHNKKKVSTKIIKDIYHAPTNDQAEKCIALIPLEKDSDDEDTVAGGGGAGTVGVVGTKLKKQNKSDSSSSSSDEEKKKKKEGENQLKIKLVKTDEKKRRGSHSSSSSSSSDEEKKPKQKELEKPKKRPTPPPSSRSTKSNKSSSKSKSCVLL